MKIMTNQAEIYRAITQRMTEDLSAKGFAPCTEHSLGNAICVFTSEDESAMVCYDAASKKLMLYRGDKEMKTDSFTLAQTYLFDIESEDSAREAQSIAGDFADTLGSKKGKSTIATVQRTRSAEHTDEDTVTATFFVNRIPTYLPECRLPLISHKEHYETLLPIKFVEEVVVVAVSDALRKKERAKLAAFFEFVSTSYDSGDLSVKGIIVDVLLNALVNVAAPAEIEEYLSDTLKKSWALGRRLIGKKIKPEKETTISKLARTQAKLGQ